MPRGAACGPKPSEHQPSLHLARMPEPQRHAQAAADARMLQVGRLDAALCRPLVELRVGCMCRRMEPDPSLLQPSGLRCLESSCTHDEEGKRTTCAVLGLHSAPDGKGLPGPNSRLIFMPKSRPRPGARKLRSSSIALLI